LGQVPFPYLAIAKDAAGFIKAHDMALNNYAFDTIVGGHLTRLGTRNDVTIQKEFVSDLEKAAGTANQEVLFITSVINNRISLVALAQLSQVFLLQRHSFRYCHLYLQ
jgi:hypothetical protein